MGDSPAAVGEFVPLEALFDGGRGPGPRLGVPRRHLVGGQIEGALLDQVDKFGAGSRRSDFFRPMAAEVLQPASEPDGVFGQNGSIGVAGHKIAEVERAVGCFGPADALHPPLDAQAAGGQCDDAGDVAVDDGSDAGSGDDPQCGGGHHRGSPFGRGWQRRLLFRAVLLLLALRFVLSDRLLQGSYQDPARHVVEFVIRADAPSIAFEKFGDAQIIGDAVQIHHSALLSLPRSRARRNSRCRQVCLFGTSRIWGSVGCFAPRLACVADNFYLLSLFRNECTRGFQCAKRIAARN